MQTLPKSSCQELAILCEREICQRWGGIEVMVFWSSAGARPALPADEAGIEHAGRWKSQRQVASLLLLLGSAFWFL